MEAELTQARQVPTIDAPVAALASSSSIVSGNIADSLRAEDKRSELTLCKMYQSAAWAIKEASLASFFNYTSLICFASYRKGFLPRMFTCSKT